MDANELRTLRQRYKAHVERREHSSTLRPGQMQLAEDLLAWLYERDEGTRDYHSSGYFVRPTGTGKTVSLIDFILGINSSVKDGDLRWDKRVLVLTPTNVLNRQFAGEMGVEQFRTPGKEYAFNIPEEKIGVYDASVADKEERQEPLGKHIVVMTYDSFVRAVEEDRLKVSDFASVLLDETHTRPHGPNTGAFIRKHIFNQQREADGTNSKLGEPAALTIGATATHLFKSGHTIGDTLFGGAQPIHLTRINNAVQEGEISGYRNVIVETLFNPGAHFDGEEDLSATERTERLKQNARDEAAVRILSHGHDPITRKRYKEMKSVWYCRDVSHAKRLMKQINAAMGTPVENTDSPPQNAYARWVSGEMDGTEFNIVVTNYKQGGAEAPKALTNAKILIHGFDDEKAELCFMTWPSGSPIEVLQEAGRVLRKHKSKPHATIFSFPDADKDSIIFGELAGSYHSIPKGPEFPQSSGGGGDGEGETPWPEEIRDLNAHYLTTQIEQFAQRRRAAQASDAKPDYMLTSKEMARQCGIDHELLEKYVFKPLQGLFDQRHSRQQELDLRDAFAADDKVFINGQRFAVGSKAYPGMGYFRTAGSDTGFCLNKEAANACRYAMFGKLPDAKPYLYNKTSARRVTGISDAKYDEASRRIEEAYHQRNNYQRVIDIDGNRFKLNEDVLFCKDQQKPKLFFSATGLKRLFQLTNGVSEEEAAPWWAGHPDKIREVKTPVWLNQQETMQELDIHARHPAGASFKTLWKKLEASYRTKKSVIGANVDGDWINCDMKRKDVMPASGKEFCLNSEFLEWFREKLDLKIGAGGESGPAKGTGR